MAKSSRATSALSFESDALLYPASKWLPEMKIAKIGVIFTTERSLRCLGRSGSTTGPSDPRSECCRLRHERPHDLDVRCDGGVHFRSKYRTSDLQKSEAFAAQMPRHAAGSPQQHSVCEKMRS